jgi:phosphoglycerate dehydrogenase-like enzyme
MIGCNHEANMTSKLSWSLSAWILLASTHPAWGQPGSAAELIRDLGLQESAQPVRALSQWQKPRKVVVLIDDEARLAWFQQAVAGSGVTIVGAHNPQEFKAAAADADAIVGTCRPDVVNVSTKLRWVQTQTAGVEDCVATPAVSDGRVLLTNMQRVSGPNVAEHVMALMLALSRCLPRFNEAQRSERWLAPSGMPLVDLEGKTLLIVGLGGNGTQIARRANAFGMRILATNVESGHEPDFVAHVGPPEELPKLIQQADVIVNTVPLTPQTTALFDAKMFALMKPAALFINVGRGKSVVTAELVSALEQHHLAGAGLDVVDPEPLPPGHPLWKMPNVIITPHVADSSQQRVQRMWVIMRENLRRYVAGEKLLSLVDVKRGY